MEPNAFDLQGLAIVLAVATAISGVGFALDKLLLQRQRDQISGKLTEWWLKIEELRFPEVGNVMATYYLSVQRYLQGSRLLSVRFLLTTIIASITITTLSILFGDYVFFGNIEQTIEYLPTYQLHFLYPINFCFDALTIVVTVLAMRAILANSWLIPAVVIVDVLLAAFSSISVWMVVDALEHPTSSTPVMNLSTLTVDVERLKIEFRIFMTYLDHIGVLDLSNPALASESVGGWFEPWPRIGGAWGRVIYSFSTLIPTAGYLIILIILVTSLMACKRCGRGT